MTQIAIGPQCAGCRRVRIGRELLNEPFAWLCDPFPKGVPREYDLGKEDCPYRQPTALDNYKPTGVPGTVKSQVL
jgi:hypothetical protein